ncbi:MAG TPA: hypothetical protein VNM92_03130 [Thermoanaerobaculia bacterium]|nr:hypothetical protein [Thermoanaerobaculia bacterium]
MLRSRIPFIMIKRSGFATAVLLLIAGHASAAAISGQVSFMTRRGQKPLMSETVVWLQPAARSTAEKKEPQRFQMPTRNRILIPHVLAVPVGSTVDFPNDDPVAHNLFSLSPGNSFDIGLQRRGSGKSEKFETPGTVNVYCNVHPNMSAIIYVVATPYYTQADATGRFSFNVPKGRYVLHASNEQGGSASNEIEVAADGTVKGEVALVLDMRRARRTQHLNKLGKPYKTPSANDY